MKIYAVLMTYEQMDWLPYTMDMLGKTLEFGSIDMVFIAEGSHSKRFPERSTDGSWEYLNNRIGDDDRYHLVDIAQFRNNQPRYDFAQAATLNHICGLFPMDEETWVFYIHDDEYFFDAFLKDIRNLCQEASSEDMNMIITKQLAFSFNMSLYWKNRTVYLLSRWNKGNYWKPATTICYPDGIPYLKKTNKIKFDSRFEYITFHFNCVKTVAREKIRYALSAEKGTSNSMEWFNKVWLAADLDNLDATYKDNKKIYGTYGFKPDSPDMGPAIWQTLDVYEGEYPEVLRTHPYMNIEDIRKV